MLTGETGAGKTMLAEAIGLLAGAPAAGALIGPHADEAYVEAEFELPDGFFDEPGLEAVAGLRPSGEDTLVVARRLLPSGRSRALVWGRTCARTDLEALGERLLEVSSQHEARRLAQPSRQLELLDAHAGCDTAGDGRRVAGAAFRRGGARAAARAEAADAARHRLDLEDLVARADAAAVQPGEPEALRAESMRLRHLDELTAAAAAAAELLSPAEGEGAQSLTARAGESVAAAAEYEPGMAAVAAELRDAAARLQECGGRAARVRRRARGRLRPARARRGPAGAVRAARAPLRRAARAGAGDGRRGSRGPRAPGRLAGGARAALGRVRGRRRAAPAPAPPS